MGPLQLYAQTDEPPEEAVQKAIIAGAPATEAQKEQSAPSKPQPGAAVPISELPAKNKSLVPQREEKKESVEDL